MKSLFYSLILFFSLPLWADFQMTNSFCDKVGLKSIPEIEGDYRVNLVAPDRLKYGFSKEVAVSIKNVGEGEYEFATKSNMQKMKTCVFEGQSYFELQKDYRPRAESLERIKGFAVFPIERLNNNQKVRFQTLLFDPESLKQSKTPFEIVDSVNCKGDQLLTLSVAECEQPMKMKYMVINTAAWTPQDFIMNSVKSAIVMNIFR